MHQHQHRHREDLSHLLLAQYRALTRLPVAPAPVECPTCEGRGGAGDRSFDANAPRDRWQECPTCDGAGTCTRDDADEAIRLGLSPDDGA